MASPPVHILTDDELLAEVKVRFELNQRALIALQLLSREQENLNRKLQLSEAMKGHFLSNIRNEINNPLTAINGLASHLMTAGGGKEEVAKIAGMIYSEAFALDFQLRNIFVAAELEAGEAKPEFSHVDIGSLVKNTIELLSCHFLSKKINVFEEICDQAAPLSYVTDAQMIQVMLINLLMNAIEFSPVGGTVRVVVQITAAGLQISVEDHGRGIDPADQGEIFDRFVQLESGTTRTHPGHGLGLSVARALVELLDGQISLVSARGAGAKFILDIPPHALAVPVTLHATDGNFFLFASDDANQGRPL